MGKSVWVRVALAALLVGSACADPSKPYWRADEYYLARLEPIADAGPQIERGRPSRVLDGLNHYVLSLPTKLLLWNWQALDHRLPEESQGLLARYLVVNGLDDVKVRHNQYAPLDEWRRLVRNENIGAGYRYTLGVLTWLQYTLFPGRVLAGLPLIGGGDHFDPYTNTIHVYSSDPTILLHEAGHAKDYVPHRWRGSGFVLPRLLPGVDLIQEASASSDAIHFLQCADEQDVELRAYRTLYPAYSSYIASYVPGGPIVLLPVVVGGHVVGRARATMRRSDLEDEAFRDEQAGQIAADGRATTTCPLPEPADPANTP